MGEAGVSGTDCWGLDIVEEVIADGIKRVVVEKKRFCFNFNLRAFYPSLFALIFF
jgi:hypothetical protein